MTWGRSTGPRAVLAKIGGAAALVEIGRQLWPVVRPAVERAG